LNGLFGIFRTAFLGLFSSLSEFDEIGDKENLKEELNFWQIFGELTN